MKAEDLRKITQDRSVELLESNKKWIIEQLKIKASAGYKECSFTLESTFEYNSKLSELLESYFEELGYNVGLSGNKLIICW